MYEDLNLKPEKVKNIIGEYMFTENPPLNDDIVDTMEKKPTILTRNPLIKKVRDSISKFIDVFIEGI